MPSTRHQQNTARLALLAMWLLLAAPLFSQALASMAPTPAWLSEMTCGEGEQHDPAAQDHAPWAQCGYCTLLLSSPALAGAPPGLAGTAGFVDLAPITQIPVALGESIVRHDAPPRAPPLPPAV